MLAGLLAFLVLHTGFPESKAVYSERDQTAVAVHNDRTDDHPHGDNDLDVTHCHPGLECSLAAIFQAVFDQTILPVFKDTPAIRRRTATTGFGIVFDPPPPRYLS